MRVEDAVDKFLYWDEEVTLMEAVTTETVSRRGLDPCDMYGTSFEAHKELNHLRTVLYHTP